MNVSRHYRRVPVQILLHSQEELEAGYLRGAGIEEFTAAEVMHDPAAFFRERRYCVELYEHCRSTQGDSKPYCIGWAIGREDRLKEEEEGERQWR